MSLLFGWTYKKVGDVKISKVRLVLWTLLNSYDCNYLNVLQTHKWALFLKSRTLNWTVNGVTGLYSQCLTTFLAPRFVKKPSTETTVYTALFCHLIQPQILMWVGIHKKAFLLLQQTSMVPHSPALAFHRRESVCLCLNTLKANEFRRYREYDTSFVLARFYLETQMLMYNMMMSMTTQDTVLKSLWHIKKTNKRNVIVSITHEINFKTGYWLVFAWTLVCDIVFTHGVLQRTGHV